MDRIRMALKEWLWAFAPGSFPYARFLFALLVGAMGGWLFAWAGLPLPWMLGSMVACTLAALMRAPVAAPGSALHVRES